MSTPDFTPLIFNTALLLALVMVYDFATIRLSMVGKPIRQAMNGLILGLIGVGIMLTPMNLEPGVVFDMRSVLLGMAGLFFGPIPAIVTMLITASLRLAQGGTAMWTGALVVVVSGGTGIFWRWFRRGALEDITWRELYLFGILIHVEMLLLMLVMPWEAALRVLHHITIPVLLLYPLATTALGLLLANRIKRERTARELEESESRYRSLFENNHAVMLIVDPVTGNITDANPAACAFYGWSRGELVGKNMSSINFMEPALLTDALNRASTNATNVFSIVHHLADGSARDVEIYSGSISIKGRPLLYSIIHDITARKRSEAETQRLISALESSRGELLSVLEDQKLAEEQVRRLNAGLEQRVRERTMELEAANRELEAFSYSVSHDLRAPLRAISGFTDILVQSLGAAANDETGHALDVIKSESLRLGRLIDDLLEFSRLGRKQLRKSTYDQTALVRDVYAHLTGHVTDRDVSFQLSTLPDAPADIRFLKQVWMNLLDNALKFTRNSDHPLITVSGSVVDREAVYAVADNGAGFDMRYVDKLFGVFQRLHNVTEFEGTGVGLALVQRLVHRHGGRVWARGAVDEGATFWFTLPLADND